MLLLMLSGIGGVSADTYVGGGLDEIEGGYDWDENGSPYIVNETLVIEAGETLTIGPGVTVLVDPGCAIVVEGTLLVEGNVTHPVVFDSNDTSHWQGMQLRLGSVANIENAVFKNATAAIEAYDCDVTIVSSKFIDGGAISPIYASFSEGGSIEVDRCTIEAASYDEKEGAISVLIDSFAEGDDCNVTEVNVKITDNVIDSTSVFYSIYIERSVRALENGTASIVGDILVSGNVIDQSGGSSNHIDIWTTLDAVDNATAIADGAISVLDNELLQADEHALNDKRGVSVQTSIAVHDSSTAQLMGDIEIVDNHVQSPFIYRGIEVTLRVEANDRGNVSVLGDVRINANEVEEAGLAFMYDCGIMARDNSTVEVDGDVCLSENTILSAGRGIEATWQADVMGNATVDAIVDLVIEGNHLCEAATSELLMAAFDVRVTLIAGQDAGSTLHLDAIVRNNIIEDAHAATSFSITGQALDRSSLVTKGSLLFEGNEISCSDGFALRIQRIAYALNDALCVTDLDICMAENDLHVQGHGGINMLDSIMAADNAVAKVHGDISVIGNDIALGPTPEGSWFDIVRSYTNSQNGTVEASSGLVIEGNDLTGAGYYGVSILQIVQSMGAENATFDWCGDVSVRGNHFGSCQSAFHGQFFIGATGYGEIDYDGALFIENNAVAEASQAFTVIQTVHASDFSELRVSSPVQINDNVVENTYVMGEVHVISNAEDNSTLSLDGGLSVENNDCTPVDRETYDERPFNSINHRAQVLAMDNATISVNMPVKISTNSGYDICLFKDVDASDNATICAAIPVCVEYNAVTGSIGAHYNLVAQSGNATVHATGDILVRHNDVGYDQVDHDSPMIIVNVNLRAECSGPQQACEVVYDADATITENDVSASPELSTVAGIAISPSVVAISAHDLPESSGSSQAKAVFGNVLVTKNSISIDAASAANPYGIYLDSDVGAYSDRGLQACAEMGSAIIENNEVWISGSRGWGINVYSDSLRAEAVGEGSISTAVAGPHLIRDNLIEMECEHGYGIMVEAMDDNYARAYDGAVAEFCMTSGTEISGNHVSMDGTVNSAIYLNAYQEAWSEGGKARYERSFAIAENDVRVEGSSAVAINVVNFSSYVYFLDGDAALVGTLTIEGNEIVMVGSDPLVAPGVPGHSLCGIYIRADCYVEPTSENGMGTLSAEVCIADNAVEGAQYGIQAYIMTESTAIVTNNTVTDAEWGLHLTSSEGVEVRDNTFKRNKCGMFVGGGSDTVIEGNAFLENGCGVHLSGDIDTIVRDNFFSKNSELGLKAESSYGLVVEDCYFYMNGDEDIFASGGARLTGVEGVVGNCTFYLNLGNGLYVDDSELIIYNGEYDQNDEYGLYVNDGSVDWIVDAEAVVHANDVVFAGEIIICGKLVLDYVDDFEMRPDGDVLFGIYNGHARLVVAKGGCLEAYNTKLEGSSDPWYFDVYGSMLMTNCVVEDAFEVYLASSDVEMTTTMIEDAYGNGIRIDGCSPVIRGCTIVDSTMDGIYIVDGARPTIVGCTIVGNDRGIYAYESSLEFVVDNIIMMNEFGIYAERVSGVIHDNVVMLNDNELFLLECDVVVEYNQFGYGRPIEMLEPLASALVQAIELLGELPMDLGPRAAPLELDYMLGELALMLMNDGIGIYAVDSCVHASNNEYGMLQTAVYLVRSDLVFSDNVRSNSFDMTYSNGTRTLSIPVTVYDGIYAVDSTLTVQGASFQVVDDAIFLESSTAVIVDSTLQAGDFELYLFRDSEAAMCGPLDKYVILDTSRLYWLGELTINVVDQDNFGIAGASVVVKDATGRVWSDGVTDRNGVFVAHAPYSLETRSGVNDSLGKTLVTAAYGDKATKSAEIDVDGDDEITMKMTIKESSLFGTSPLVLGVVALVIVAVIVGAVMLARKK